MPWSRLARVSVTGHSVCLTLMDSLLNSQTWSGDMRMWKVVRTSPIMISVSAGAPLSLPGASSVSLLIPVSPVVPVAVAVTITSVPRSAPFPSSLSSVPRAGTITAVVSHAVARAIVPSRLTPWSLMIRIGLRRMSSLVIQVPHSRTICTTSAFNWRLRHSCCLRYREAVRVFGSR